MKHRVVLLFVLLSILFMFQRISTAATLPEGADVVAPYTGSEIKFLDLEIPERLQNVKLGISWDVEYCTADHFELSSQMCTQLDDNKTVYNKDDVTGIEKGYYVVSTYNPGYAACVFAIDDVKTRVIVVPDEKSKYYGDDEPEHTYTLKSESGTDLTGKLDIRGELLREVSVSQEDGEAVGTYGYNISYLKLSEAHAAKYELVLDETVEFTIKPLEVKIEWGNNIFPYDGNSHAPEATVSNLVKGDDCVVTVEGEQTEAIPGYKVYIATATGLTGADSSNYVLPDPAPTKRFRIHEAELKLTWVEPFEFEYNGKSQHPSFTLTGCVGSDAADSEGTCKETFIETNIETEGNTAAGTYHTQVYLSEEQKNYELSYTDTDYTITPKDITLNWEDTNFNEAGEILLEYNGEFQSPKVSIPKGSLVDGDTCKLKFEDDDQLKNVKSGRKKAEASFVEKDCNKNYKITNPMAIFRIAPKTVDLTWEGDTFTYTGDEQKPTASYKDVNDNTVEVPAESIQTDPFSSVNADSYSASAESDDQNYQFSEATATHAFTITPKTVNVTWNTKTFEYNGEIQRPEPSIEEGGLAPVDAERCKIDSTGDNNKEASEDPYYANAQWAKASDVSCESNYILENKTDEYYITPKDLKLTWAEVVDHEYDGEAYFPEFTLTGCVGTDGDSDGICTAEFIKEYVNTTDASVNVGTYMATVSMGENQPNYKLPGETDTSFAITPAQVNEILWSEDAPFTYNASAQAPKAQYRDVKGELVDAIVKIKEQDQAINADKYTALAETGSNNYKFTDSAITEKTFEIQKDSLTVIPVSPLSKRYGEYDPEFKYKIINRNGDNVQGLVEYPGSMLTVDYKNEEPKANHTYNFSLEKMFLQDRFDANYKLVLAETPKFQVLDGENAITEFPKSLNVTYNGDDQVVISPAKAKFGTVLYSWDQETWTEDLPKWKNAGNTDTFWYKVDGGENHEDIAPASLYATVLPARLTVTPDSGQTKVYGEADPDKFTYTVSGNVAGETPVFTGVLKRETGENVKTYKIGNGSLKLESNVEVNKNYVYEPTTGFSQNVLFTITPKVVELTWSDTEFTYDGKEHVQTAKVVGDDECVVTVEGAQKNAGTGYPARATALSNPNYTLEGAANISTTFNINKAVLTVTPVDGQSKVWDGNAPEEIKFTVDGVAEGDEPLTGALALDTEVYDAGEYEITSGTLTVVDKNYDLNFNFTKDVTYEIKKAQASITKAPTRIGGLVYNGGEQNLVRPGEADGGKLMYFFKGGEKSDTPPQGKDAGEYRVYYYVKGDNNHEDLVGPETQDDPQRYNGIKVTIAPAQATVKADDITITYGDPEPTLTATVTGLQGEDTKDLIVYELKREEGDNAGTYKITASGEEEQGNYVVSFGSGTLTINKAQSAFAAEPKGISGLVYNGQPQTLIEAGQTKDGQFQYRLVGGSGYSTELPQATDANENYCVQYYIKGDENHEDLGSAASPYNLVYVPIAQAEVTVTAEDKTIIYGEPEPKLTAKVEGLQGEDTEGLIEYTISRKSGDNVGEYVITPAGEKSQGNYSVSFVPGKLTITKAKASILVEPQAKNLVYNGEAQDLLEPGKADGGDIMYFFKGGEESTTPPKGTETGEYRVYYYVRGDENHEDLVDPTNPEDSHRYHGVKVTIAPAKVTVTANDITVTYGDEIPELSATVKGLFGEDTVDYELSRKEGDNAGTYEITVTGDAEQGNYNVTFVPGTLTIEPYSEQITVTVEGETDIRTYTSEEQTHSGYKLTSDNELYDPDQNVQYNGEGEAKGTTVGEYLMGLAAEDFKNTSANFTNVVFDVTDGKLTIEPLLAEIEWHGRVQYYDGTPILPEAKVSNLFEGDECEVTVVCYDEHINAGVYKAYATALSNENYKLPSDAPWTDYEIRESMVEVEWIEIEKVYSGEPQLPTAKLNGLPEGETCTVVIKIEGGDAVDVNEYTAKAVSFEEELCRQNHILSDKNITTPFKITPKTVDLTWTPDGDPILFSYDGQPHRPEASYTNVKDETVDVKDEEITITPDGQAVNFGKYTATAESADKNYVFSKDTASKEFQIEAKVIVIVPDPNQNMVFGTSDDELNLTYTLQDEGGNPVSEPELVGKLGHDGYAVGGWPYNMGTLDLKPEDKGNYTLTLDSTAQFAINPKPVHVTWGNTELTYSGNPQAPVVYVPDAELVTLDGTRIECGVTLTKGSYNTDARKGYTAEVEKLENGNYELASDAVKTMTYNIAKAKLEPGEDKDFTAPEGKVNLTYTGQAQDLITGGTGKCVDENYCTFQYEVTDFESEMITKDVSMSGTIPQGADTGTYTIAWMVKSNNPNIEDYIPDEPITVRIAPTELNKNNIVITPQTSFVYDHTQKSVEFTVVGSDGRTPLTKDVDYTVVKAETSAFAVGTYEIVINGLGGYTGTNVRKTWEIIDNETIKPFEFYRLNGFWDRETNCPAFGCGQQLPATGFPTRFRMPLSVRPDGLKYQDLGMRLQIPALAVNVDLVGVPQLGNDWAIEWLGADAGILSGTSEPGRGYTMIAGHNHLNESEMGPFLNLGSLKQYDTIYISLENGMNLPFSVYANELMRPDDYEAIAKIAAEDPHSIVLVTCENETAAGGYMNRRVVFAKPF